MVAQIFGELRPDKATYGEKLVYKKLRDNLPKEFSVYVECQIHNKRELRFPDFVVLTNYGVIILEVKDYVDIQQADQYGALINTKDNRTRKVANPVHIARDYAISFSNNLRQFAKVNKTKNPGYIP